MKKLSKAILSIQPSAEFVLRGTSYSDIEWHSDNPPTEQEVMDALVALDALEYQDKRAAEYPSVVDQLDLLYHGGYDTWKQSIKAIKDKYPKGQTMSTLVTTVLIEATKEQQQQIEEIKAEIKS